MILWEISDATTTAVFPSAGSVMAPMTVVTAQTRGTAVSVFTFFTSIYFSATRVTRQDFFVFVIWFVNLGIAKKCQN